MGNGTPLKFNRNTLFLSVLLGGALGSFTLATMTGKNGVHKLHNFFNRGKIDTSIPYQKKLNEAHGQEDVDDVETRRARRMTRRETFAKHLEEGSGLLDSHGGHWLAEKETDEKQ